MAEIAPLNPIVSLRPAVAPPRRTPAPPDRTRHDPEPLWREALGQRLRGIRHERGERLIDTAERAGVSPQYLSEVERGLKDPSSEMMAAVAGALEVTVLELVAAIAADLRSEAPARSASASVSRGAFALAA